MPAKGELIHLKAYLIPILRHFDQIDVFDARLFPSIGQAEHDKPQVD